MPEIKSSVKEGLEGERREFSENQLYGPTVTLDERFHIHSCFEEKARNSPQAVAIISGKDRLTYGELDIRSNALAEAIRSSVFAEESLVGVSMNRSIGVVTALLGILKSGCAYVPLDPTYPTDRLKYMLKDSAIELLITDAHSDQLPVLSSVRRLCLDQNWYRDHRTSDSSTFFSSNFGKNSLAYVLYTSGSTGKPKGVCCLHKGVTNLLDDFDNRQPLGQDDVCSWWTSLNFDVSVYEIFSPLFAGATLIIVPDSIRSDASAVMDWLAKCCVTSAYIPPFMVADLEAWVRKNPGQSRLRRLLVGVEPIPERTLLAIHKAIPGVHVINGYGPTETTVCATLYSVDPGNRVHQNTPLGKPVQNLLLRILDTDGRPVAPGDPGELYIGGTGVARGYLNQEELTAARFVRDPFSDVPDNCLYKTGDVVRLLDDGNLEFVGRSDFQVKIRGFRVELGEIETELRKVEGIREAVVLLREDEPGYRQLAAYLVFREGDAVSLESLRKHLKQYLPGYMIPAAFVRIDRIPSTPNGKTDRDALPRPSRSNVLRGLEDEASAPCNKTETTLMNLFQEVLRLPYIGIHDNFFEWGGHSLLAVQLASRIRDAFQVYLSVATVFGAPTVKALAEEIEALSSRSTPHSVRPLASQEGVAEQSVSFSQMRLWYLDQLEPGTPAYNICLAYKILGLLDVDALSMSISRIVQRHQSLRTFFEVGASGPVPAHRSDQEFTPAFIDLTHLPEHERELAALRLCNEEARTGFDLLSGPLFRCCIFRLDANEHVLIMTVHHIVSDGWSLGIILRELMQLYSGITTRTTISIPHQPHEYGDFARDQISWMTTEQSHSQIQFWNRLFRNIPEPLDLITDLPRPLIQSYHGASVSLILDETILASVNNIASRKVATRFMVLLAAFKALLNRYTQQGDICVGTVSANRNRREFEDIVGFFVNTLPIRTDLWDDPPFDELVERVKRNAIDAFTNQDLPFERVLQEVNPDRNLSRTPLFQTMFVLHNMPLPALTLPGLRCDPIELETFRANFDLTVWVHESEDRLRMVLDYSTDLFDRDTMSRLLVNYQNLLADACRNPRRRVSQLDLLTESESQAMLNGWRGAKKGEIFSERLVTDLIQEQVRRAPDHTALVAFGSNSGPLEEYSYSVIEKGANRIARVLSRRGIGPGTITALQMERSPLLIMAILGVLKTGGAYLPVDSNYPLKRVVFMLNDAAPPLVLTDSSNCSKMQAILSDQGLNNSPDLICIDTELIEEEEGSEEDLLRKPDPADAAYIIYTSGSTGDPKGVIVEHRALAAFTQSAMELYGLGPGDRILQFASLSFDASVEEIFVSLACGASLVLRSDDMVRSIPTFVSACRDAGVTCLDLPTAFWHQFTNAVVEGIIKLPESVRLVIVGGEQLSVDSVAAWVKATGSHVRLFNTYGPTEATVVTTAMELSRVDPSELIRARVPIGKPLRHAKTYVLDTNLKAVPFGVPGELFIGGNALARGYLNLPDRTQEVFIRDPYGQSEYDRLYRTGDRARFRPDGILEFLGRVDRQVKIRGFRVELGEVEAALRRLPQVREAAVIANSDMDGLVRLVAYVVPFQGLDTTPTEIRSTLSSDLPEFMIPSAFVILETLPLTPAGKIDTRALPSPSLSIREDADIGIPPRNPVEAVLADVWCKVFGIPTVGMRDNFFDLGGHSLLSLRIIDRLSRSGISLTPAQFIQNPTIEKQAKVVSTARPSTDSDEWLSLVELQPYGSLPPIFFLHSAPGDVLGYVNLINRLGPDQPCFGFQSIGLVNPDMAHTRIEDMASFYIDEMLRLRPDPPHCLLGWCYGGLVAAEMAIQLHTRGLDLGLLVLLETPFPKTYGADARYYVRRFWSLTQMGPRGWMLYARNRRRYKQKVRRGDMANLFSLEFDQGAFAHRSSVYRSNWEAVSQYRMKGSPCCPTRIFTGNQLEEGYIPDIEKSWLRIGADVQEYQVPGTHLTILKEPGATIVASKLKQALAEIGWNRKPGTQMQ